MSDLDPAVQNMIDNLEEKFGKSFDEWIAIVQKSGQTKVGAMIKFLKTEHGFTHGYANLVALTVKDRAAAAAGEKPDDPVEAQYAGDKAALRPIYDALAAKIRAFGKDVEFAPKKAYVSLRRKKQFGLIQPSTRTRVDVGFVLKDVDPQGKLENSGSFNAMCTHRWRLESVSDIDAELIKWLKAAYEEAG